MTGSVEELIDRLKAGTVRFARGAVGGRASGAHVPGDPENDYYCGYEWEAGGEWHRCTEHHAHSTYHGCPCGVRLDGRGLRR